MARVHSMRTALAGFTVFVMSIIAGGTDAGIYIKFGEIDGESNYKSGSHSWSDADTFSQEVKIGNPSAGRRGTKVTPEPILITKPVDRITPYLLESTMTKKVFKRLTIHVTESKGKKEILVYSLKLDNVRIMSHKVSGTKRHHARPIEEVRVTYTAMKVDYFQIDQAGAGTGKFEYHWRGVGDK